jgi:hypothetical protein
VGKMQCEGAEKRMHSHHPRATGHLYSKWGIHGKHPMGSSAPMQMQMQIKAADADQSTRCRPKKQVQAKAADAGQISRANEFLIQLAPAYSR